MYHFLKAHKCFAVSSYIQNDLPEQQNLEQMLIAFSAYSKAIAHLLVE